MRVGNEIGLMLYMLSKHMQEETSADLQGEVKGQIF